jgi:RNA polymerase sigma factor (sigma-70 family)
MLFLESWSSDASLVREALADRREAFEALVLRYQQKAHAIARAIGVPADSVDDVVQESFLQAFCGLRKLSSPASFGPWLLTIVRNLSRRHLERSPRSVPLEAAIEPVDEPPGDAEDVRAVSDRLRREVQELPESLRETIYLYYYEGLSTRRVAQTLEISPSAVKVRLLRGRDLLRERLWRSLEGSLRESIPSPRLWKRKGRKLALFLIATVTLRTGASAAAAGSAAAGGAGWLTNAAMGVLVMSSKKIILGAAIAILLVSAAVVILLNSAPDRPAAEKTGLADSGNAGAGGPPAAAEAPAGKGKATPVASAPAAIRRTGVAGTVLRDGAPAPGGVQVAAGFEGRWGQAASTRTLNDGTYLIGDLPPGQYRLFAWSGAWTTRPAEGDRETVEVRKGELTEGVDLTLVPGAVLKGQVIERSTKSPIPGATVESFFQTVVTDAEGRFTIEGLHAGSVLLVARAKGFAREMEQVDLSLGEENSTTINMVPGGAIEGMVTDSAGKPVPAADVMADWGPTASVKTDRAGRYVVEGITLASKDIKVTASKDGVSAVKAVVPGFPHGESRVTLDLQLEKGIVLKGLVVDAGDQPVSDAMILFGDQSGEGGAHGMVYTGDDGRFTIKGASEKTLSLTAQKSGFAPSMISLSNLSPEAREDLRIVLRPGHFLAGTVTDAKGSPVVGAQIYAYFPSASHSVRSDAGGRFRLTDLAPAVSSLWITKEGFAEGSIQDVKTDREDLSIILEEAGQIVGVAVDKADFSPVHPIRVQLVMEGEQGMRYTSAWKNFDAADGGFKLTDRIKAGQVCKVVVASEDYGEAEVDGVTAWPLSESRGPIRVELQKGGTLNGRVIDAATGAGIAGAKVRFLAAKAGGAGEMERRLWPEGGTARGAGVRISETDGQGKFQIQGILAGGGALFLEKQGYARRLIAPIGTDFDNQVFELTPAAILTGTVRTEDGKPIAEARVECAVKGLVFPEVTTDTEGRYLIEDLPAGKAEVRMDRRSAASFMQQKPQTAVLIAGESSTADFIESGGSISGKVTTRKGEPIPDARVLVKSTTDIRQPTIVLAVDSEGMYRLGGVPPGIYDVRVEVPGRSADLPEGAQKQVVVESDESVCNFSLNPSNPICVVIGRVTDRRTGNPVPGVKVELRERTKGYSVCGDLKMPDTEWLIYGQAAMGNEESFRMEVFTAGSYLLTASTGKEAGAGLRGWAGPFDLKPSKNPVEVTIEVGGDAGLSLSVTDAASKAAVAGCAISLHPVGGFPVEYLAKSDESGKAAIEGLAPGRYQLEVASDLHARHKEVVTISKGTTARAVALEKSAWIQVAIEGSLKDKSECYLAAAAVAGGDPGWEYLSKDGTQPATCGAFKPGGGGQASVRLKARPGQYKIRFEIVAGDAAVHAETQDVEVPEGGEGQVRVTLPAN